MIRSPHSLASLCLALLFPLLALAGCASDGAQSQKDKESWRTASQRVPDQSRRPSPSELAKQAKARDLMAEKAESQDESETETESADAAGKSDELPEEPIRLDPDGPEDRDSYVRPDGEEIPAAVKVHDPQPRYTEEAREAGIKGTVVFDLYIDETGTVQGADLLKALPKGLTLEVYKAVKTWRFEPAIVNGQPIKVIHRVTVSFK